MNRRPPDGQRADADALSVGLGRARSRTGSAAQGNAVPHTEDTPDGLKTMIAADYGKEPTLESVFMTFTGRSLDDDIGDDENKEDDQ